MSAAEALVRTAFAMAVVLGLLWGVARFLRAKQGIGPVGGSSRRRSAGPNLEVLARQPLTRTAAVALVRAGDSGQAWLIGVTDSQVTLLSETDVALPEPEPDGAATTRQAPASMGDLLELLRQKTARR